MNAGSDWSSSRALLTLKPSPRRGGTNLPARASLPYCRARRQMERGAAVGVNDVALGAGIGPAERTEEVLRDADGLHGVRSGGAEHRREVAIVPSPRCLDGRRADERGEGDGGNRRHERKMQS